MSAIARVKYEPNEMQHSELPKVAVRQLKLTQYRNHPALKLVIDQPIVVITGQNGTGKTNILEALSYFSPGRGLRGAVLSDMLPAAYGSLGAPQAAAWGVGATVATPDGPIKLATGYERLGTGQERRQCKINDVPRPQSEFSSVLNMLWLTPQMDRIFIDGTSARRRFFDRLVFSFDPGHARRVQQYEHAMRERLRLLKTHSMPNTQWLEALEQKMTEFAVAIAASRLEVISAFSEYQAGHDALFPRADLGISGYAEDRLRTQPAVTVEDALKAELTKMRPLDRDTGRTQVGAHKCDFHVVFHAKGQPAERCSTGEQKALLLSIVMTAIHLHQQKSQVAPIVLFDEVIAHLDPERRAQCLRQIQELGVQVWLTGTCREAFSALEGVGTYFELEDNGIKGP